MMAGKARIQPKIQGSTRQPGSGDLSQSPVPSSTEMVSLQANVGNTAVSVAVQGAGNETPPIVRHVLSRSGQPLELTVRAFMESRFGHDFSDVHVHADAEAAESAQAIGAKGYTVGSDVVFSAGHYDPSSDEGKQLIAHELAHVVQQERGGPPPPLDDNAQHEQFAAQAAAQAVANGNRGQSISVGGATSIGLARETDEERKQRQQDPLIVPPITKMIVLPSFGVSEKAMLASLARLIQNIKPPTSDGGAYTAIWQGQALELSRSQVDQLRGKFIESVRNAIAKSKSDASYAEGRYIAQDEVNKEFRITSASVHAIRWITTLGEFNDPKQLVNRLAGNTKSAAESALKALDEGRYADAASLLAESEASSRQVRDIVQRYVEGLIETGESTVTSLEYTRNAAFITLGVLAVIATGGAAAGGATAFGVDLGVSSATAANVIATGAPIVATLGSAGVQVALGDTVDWGHVALDVAVQLVLARFGGKLSDGLFKALAGNPVVVGLGRQVFASIVSNVLTGAASRAFGASVDAVYSKLKGQDITWAKFTDELLQHLTDPKAIFIDLIMTAVQMGARSKFVGPLPPSSKGKITPPPVKDQNNLPVKPSDQAVMPPPKKDGTRVDNTTAILPKPNVGLADRGYQPKPGERNMTREDWKKAVDQAFEGDIGEQANVERVTGKSDPRIAGKRVPDETQRKMDIEDLPLKSGETQRKAVARIRTIIGKKLSDYPVLETAWNDAKAMVLKNNTLGPHNAEALFNKTRVAFMRRVRNKSQYPDAAKLFQDAGFEFPEGTGTMPLLEGVNPSIPVEETRISLDHVEEKGQGNGWQKALDADNLKMEFARPNTERENKQMRHPELRP